MLFVLDEFLFENWIKAKIELYPLQEIVILAFPKKTYTKTKREILNDN